MLGMYIVLKLVSMTALAIVTSSLGVHIGKNREKYGEETDTWPIKETRETVHMIYIIVTLYLVVFFSMIF